MSITSNYLKRKILQKLKDLKHSRFENTHLKGSHAGTEYKLVLLTEETVNDNKIIALLSNWRKIHEKWFPAQFKVTTEGTKKWLKKRVIETPDRLLFMIKVNNNYVGHVGLFRFNFKNLTYELDNIVRGESKYPGIITDAIRNLMDWGKRELGVKWYILQTSSDNEKALKLYKNLGFRESKRIPLVHIKRKNRTEWVNAPKKYKRKIDRFNIYMNNKKISFAGPWITEREVDYVVDGTVNGFYETFFINIKKLEKTMADYLGVKYALGTHCCTLALHLACLACDLKPGDEVICTDFSWIATAYPIVYVGATPVFVDIDPNSWCIDPKAIELAITKRTKAIMLVHTFGHPAQMDEIMRIAKKYDLKVIEDAAPSLGAEFKGKKVGTFGTVGCFSFHGAKIAASGEGGMFVTNDRKIFEKASLLASMGRTDSKAVFWSDLLGYQYTIGNLASSLALAQVERIDELVKKKRMIFEWYFERLKNVKGVKIVREKKDCKSNYCYPSILLDENLTVSRDEVVKKLGENNIHSRATFPRMSKFPVFKGQFKSVHQFKNPVSEKVAKYGISLPSAANLVEKDIDYVCETLSKIIYN